jgi:hypothetical protein
LFVALAGLQERREVRALPKFRDRDVDLSGAGVPRAVAVPVAMRDTELGANKLSDFGLNRLADHERDALANHIAVIAQQLFRGAARRGRTLGSGHRDVPLGSWGELLPGSPRTDERRGGPSLPGRALTTLLHHF